MQVVRVQIKTTNNKQTLFSTGAVVGIVVAVVAAGVTFLLGEQTG